MEMSVEACRNDVAEVKIDVVWWKNEYFYYCDRVRMKSRKNSREFLRKRSNHENNQQNHFNDFV